MPQKKSNLNHNKYTAIVLFSAVFTWIISKLITGYLLESSYFLEQIEMWIFFIFVIFFLAWMIFRTSYMKCPECGKLIKNFSYSEENKGKVFSCIPCDIDWDSGIIEDGGD